MPGYDTALFGFMIKRAPADIGAPSFTIQTD